MPQQIIDMIETEIERRVAKSMKDLAVELRQVHAKIDDDARLNEIEIQLGQGLHHLAVRLNQGTQVEINRGGPRKLDG